jgi:methionyl-tRNA formyltransferase
MRILFAGHQKWACMALEELVKNNHEIVGVVAEKDEFDNKESETYKRFKEYGFFESLKDTARAIGLNVLQPDDINSSEFIKEIGKLNPDLITIVSYHSIVRRELIDKYKNRIINAHGALLPKYRGRAPINWAIINGEKEAGVTVHFVAEKVDSGDIIAQERVPIEMEDTAIDVLKKSLPLYPKLVLEAVMQIEKGEVKATKQDLSKGSYFKSRKPEDGLIDWNKNTIQLYNWVRALTHPYPGAFTYHNSKKIFIWKAALPEGYEKTGFNPGYVVEEHGKNVKVATADSYILLNRVQFEGCEERDAAECLEGKITLGR